MHVAGLQLARRGSVLLRGVDLSLSPGELLALVGPNGAGKSTLLDVLAGGLRPARGVATWRGRPLSAGAALARERAVVRQRQELVFPLTASEVVALGRHPHGPHPDDPARVRRALHRVGAAHLADRPFTALSGGERQRVDLARALCQLDAPGLLLLDEPTSAQDLGHQQQVLGLARGLAAEGHAVLAALHDLGAAAAFADRVAVLHGGRIVADGPPAEVLTPALLREVFAVRAEVFVRDGHLFVHPLPLESPC